MEETIVLLRNKGKIDPKNAADYVKTGGYEALRKALSMSGAEIIEELKQAGLRGRGAQASRLTGSCSLLMTRRVM
ncbi:MAG: hypothetical protein ACLUD2_06070 [Clostridium sp.]